MNIEETRNAQRERAKKYPADRICFMRTQNAINEDQASFKAFARGEITLQMLCRCLARANYLDEVTEAQALRELKETGWKL